MKLMKVIMMSATFAIGCAVNAAEQGQVEQKRQAEGLNEKGRMSIILHPSRDAYPLSKAAMIRSAVADCSKIPQPVASLIVGYLDMQEYVQKDQPVLKRSRSTGSLCSILAPAKKLSAIFEVSPQFTKDEQQDLKLISEQFLKPASSNEVIALAEQGIQQIGRADCEFADALRYTLLFAVRRGNFSMVKRMLEGSNFLRANIATRLHAGENYLCEREGDTLYSIAARLGHKKTLKQLLDYRCLVVKKSFIQDQEISCLDIENSVGDTPVIIAARQNNSECVKLLIEAEADVLAENRQGESASSVTTSPTIKKTVTQAIKEQKEREAKLAYSSCKTS